MKHYSTEQPKQAGSSLEHATVKACTEAGLIVHGPGGVATAQTAVGCLIEPMAGDRVLLSRSGDECFVLTVLARTGDKRQINIAGDLSISAERLHVLGREEACIDSSEHLQMRSSRIAVVSGEAEIHGQRITVSAEEGHAHFRTTRLVASAIEIVGDRIAQCARQVVRRVEDVETLHVGNLVQRVRENLLSRSKRTSMTASKDVHIDGERIHMG